MIIEIITTLFPVFGIIALGMVAGRRHLLPPTTAECLNQFVYWIALPSMMFCLMAATPLDILKPRLLLSLLLAQGFCHGLTFFVYHYWYSKTSSEGIMYAYMASFPNSAFMGMAVLYFLFPGNHVALAMGGVVTVTYFLVMILTDALLAVRMRSGEQPFFRSLARAICYNPMIIGATAGGLFTLFNSAPPRPLLNLLSMLGTTAAPCALFCMGLVLQVRLTTFHDIPTGLGIRQLPLHGIKLFLFPVILYVLLRLVGVSGAELGAAIIIAAMPIGVASYVIAEKYNLTVDDASIGICVSTALSVITLPITIIILQYLGAL